MDKGRFLIETHVRTGRPVAELAAHHYASGISLEDRWFFGFGRRAGAQAASRSSVTNGGPGPVDQEVDRRAHGDSGGRSSSARSRFLDLLVHRRI